MKFVPLFSLCLQRAQAQKWRDIQCVPVLSTKWICAVVMFSVAASWLRRPPSGGEQSSEVSVNSSCFGHWSPLQVEGWAKVELCCSLTGSNTWSLFNGFVLLQGKQILFGKRQTEKFPVAHLHRIQAENNLPLYIWLRELLDRSHVVEQSFGPTWPLRM